MKKGHYFSIIAALGVTFLAAQLMLQPHKDPPKSRFNHIEVVRCATNDFCVAIGEPATTTGRQKSVVVQSSDAGAHWRIIEIPNWRDYEARAINCIGPSTCLISGSTPLKHRTKFDKLFLTQNAGKSWKVITVQGPPWPSGVSCYRPHNCSALFSWAPNYRFKFSSDSGQSWQEGARQSSFKYNLDCFNASRCVAQSAALSGGVVFTDDGGRSWREASLPSSLISWQVRASCLSEQVCLIGDARRIWRTSDGGKSFRAVLGEKGQAIVGDGISEIAFDCPNDQICFAVSDGFSTGFRLAMSRTGGSSWISTEGVSRLELPGALSCPSTTTCYAAGHSDYGAQFIYKTSDAGAHWSRTKVS